MSDEFTIYPIEYLREQLCNDRALDLALWFNREDVLGMYQAEHGEEEALGTLLCTSVVLHLNGMMPEDMFAKLNEMVRDTRGEGDPDNVIDMYGWAAVNRFSLGFFEKLDAMQAAEEAGELPPEDTPLH